MIPSVFWDELSGIVYCLRFTVIPSEEQVVFSPINNGVQKGYLLVVLDIGELYGGW